MQAAILRIKLRHLNNSTNKRREVASEYIKNIVNSNIILPKIKNPLKDKSHVWHLFVIRTKNRNKLQKYLLDKGVQTLIHYPIPPHKQKAYKKLNKKKFPITEKIHNQALSLPISSLQNKRDTFKIIECLNNWKI